MGALNSAQSHINRFQHHANRILQNRAASGAGMLFRRAALVPPTPNQVLPKQTEHLTGMRYYSLGRFAQGLFIRGLGGGFVGGLIGVLGYGFAQALGGIAMGIGRRVTQFLTEAIDEGLKFTRLETGLRFLAQSGPRATSWMKQMLELSAASGFNINQMGTAFQTLAGQTTDIRQIPPIMRAITEISTGLGLDAERMNRLALAIGQVAAAGRFEGQEILQLTESIPIKHFADTAGISIGEFRKRMREGTLSVDILWQTLNRLALSPGGAFFRRLDKQAETALGQVMQIQQQFMLLKTTIGKGLLEELKDQGVLSAISQGLGFLLGNQGQVRSFLKDMVDTFKQIAIGTARWAGIIYDTINFLIRNRWIFYVMSGGTALPIEIALKLAGKITKGDFARGTTGDVWAKEVADAFNRKFVPTVQGAINQINIPKKLSSEAQKLVDTIRDGMRESPFKNFEQQLRLIREAETFKPDWFTTWARGKESFDPFTSEEAGFGRANAFLKLEESLEKMANELPRAMTAGSTEAQSAINKALNKGPQQTIQERIARTLEAAKKQDERRNQLLREIANAMRPRPSIFGIPIPSA